MQLYGFLTGEDLQVFRLLIGVSGIGPKAGLNILSCLSPDELRFAVMAGDVKTISSAPGIGKKTAEKLILELKDKMSIEDVLEQAAHGSEQSKDCLLYTSRRYKELVEKGVQCDLKEIEKDIEERDYLDMTRKIAPLKKAEDAILVDSSDMTLKEVVNTISRYCHR